MNKLILYTPRERPYVFNSGALATSEIILEQYPAIETIPFVIETDETETMFLSLYSLVRLRSDYNIDPSLSNEDALAAVIDAMNALAQAQAEAQAAAQLLPTPEERMAAAMELQTLLMM